MKGIIFSLVVVLLIACDQTHTRKMEITFDDGTVEVVYLTFDIKRSNYLKDGCIVYSNGAICNVIEYRILD